MRTTVTALAILAVVAAGYFLFARTAVAPVEDGVATSTAKTLTLATSTLSEEGAEYSVDVEYPQFGDETIDAQIRDAVASAAAELKTQAANDAPVSEGFRKYEFIGMYSDV